MASIMAQPIGDMNSLMNNTLNNISAAIHTNWA